MKKHELLKNAYDNYPTGVKFIPFIDKGTYISSGKFKIVEDDFNAIFDEENGHYIHEYGRWAEIIKPQKIAVKIEDEKDFQTLVRYYESLKFSHVGLEKPFKLIDFEYGTCFTFHDKWFSVKDDDCEYRIIPFSDFAKEHSIKSPLIKSEDGVWLYEGDEYFSIYLFESKWLLSNIDEAYTLKDIKSIFLSAGDRASLFLENPDKYKAFSTKQSALEWIESQKPTEIKVDLFDKEIYAVVSKKQIVFKWKTGHTRTIEKLYPSDIEELTKAINELNKD